jgi:acetyl/propionyl-CoA carboxylase alpha subunit
MRHAFALAGTEHDVRLSHADATGQRTLHALGTQAPVALTLGADGRGTIRAGGRTRPVAVALDGDRVHVHLDGETWLLEHRHPLARAAAEAHGAGEDEARAPMPGTVVSLSARPGQAVTRGEPLLVMESMKLETTIAAWRDGVVHEVRVAVGQVFDRDAVLITLEPPQ